MNLKHQNPYSCSGFYLVSFTNNGYLKRKKKTQHFYFTLFVRTLLSGELLVRAVVFRIHPPCAVVIRLVPIVFTRSLLALN